MRMCTVSKHKIIETDYSSLRKCVMTRIDGADSVVFGSELVLKESCAQ